MASRLSVAGVGPETSVTWPGPPSVKSDGAMPLRAVVPRLVTSSSTVTTSPTGTIRGLVTMAAVSPAAAVVTMVVVLELEVAVATAAPELASVPAALPAKRTVPLLAADVLYVHTKVTLAPPAIGAGEGELSRDTTTPATVGVSADGVTAFAVAPPVLVTSIFTANWLAATAAGGEVIDEVS